MMEYIDFVSVDAKCSSCNRILSSGTAIISGSLRLGPDCAKKRNINSKEIPNLTKGIISDKELASDKHMNKEVSDNTIQNDISDKLAQSYLIIRCEKLIDFTEMKYPPLDEIYQKYKTETLTESDLNYLRNIIKKSNEKNPKYSIDNMFFLYAVKRAFDFIINRNPNNNFYKNLLNFVKKNYFLSEKQFDCIKTDVPFKIKYFNYNLNRRC